MDASPLVKFIKERHAIYRAREAGKSKPWTADPILTGYRFCNVYRELDTVTRWLRDNWYVKNPTSKNLIFAACLARYVNWPDTLAEIGFPQGDAVLHVKKVLKARRLRGEKVYTGAYMIRSDRDTPFKEDYIARVLSYVKAANLDFKGKPLWECHAELRALHGWGSFLAAQVICDLKYTPLLVGANDWWTFAAIGPGSARGMNRVLQNEVSAPWDEVEWHAHLIKLQKVVNRSIESSMPVLHAQDLQNCLCEFDKYERVRLGQGRPRSLYNGGL